MIHLTSLWLGISVALGQAVPNGDFELGAQDWEDLSYECVLIDNYPFGSEWVCEGIPPAGLEFVVGNTTMRGSWGGEFPANGTDKYSYYGYYWRAATRSAPFVVHQERIGWAETPYGNLRVEVEAAGAEPAWIVQEDGPPSVDSFFEREADVSAWCGQEVQLRFEASSGDEAFLDDVHVLGPVCGIFVDDDADGFCEEGIDLDGDGQCIGVGEATPAVIQDCDDADPAFAASCVELALEHDPFLYRSQRNELVVRNAAPGETILFFLGDAEGQTCGAGTPYPAACVDLGGTVIPLGQAVADATGTAVLDRHVGGGADIGKQWYLQALAPRGVDGIDAVATPVSEATVVWSDGPAPGLPIWNGDFETDAMDAFAPIESAFTFGWYTYACEGPAHATTARGTSLVVAEGDDCGAVSWPIRVTHRGLAVSTQSIDPGIVAANVATAPRADGFYDHILDVSDQCAQDIALELAPGVYDDFRHWGPPCEAYVDRDGDGVCASGVDLDGDGACVGPGEPTVVSPPVVEPLQRVIADFEDGTLQGLNKHAVVDGAAVAPHQPHGQYAGLLEENWLYDPDMLPPHFSGLLVTWDTIAVDALEMGVHAWQGSTIQLSAMDQWWSVFVDSGVLALGDPGVWTQATIDMSPTCGLTLDRLDVMTGGQVLVDDVGFVGDPCPMFVDGDGDGLCHEGVDLDGDGLCVDGAEPTPGTVQDPGDPGMAP